jgi:opacity protein-like surface antigen
MNALPVLVSLLCSPSHSAPLLPPVEAIEAAVGAPVAEPRVARAPSVSATVLDDDAAESDSVRTWYAKASFGQGLLFDGDLDRSAGPVSGDGDGEYAAGAYFGGGLGYDLDPRWSLEIDFVYRSNDLDRATFGGTTAATNGDFASTVVSFSALRRFATETRVRPYVGAGLAYVTEIDIDLVDGGGETSFSDSGLGAQLMVGVEWELTEHVALYAEARYLQAFDVDMGPEVATTPGRIAGDYAHLGVALGVAIGF